MTPVAAYYIFSANESARADEAAHRIAVRRPRSVLERVRALAAALRPRRSLARSA